MNNSLNIRIFGKKGVDLFFFNQIELFESRTNSGNFFNAVQHFQTRIRKIINNNHFITRILQFDSRMRANVSGTSGN